MVNKMSSQPKCPQTQHEGHNTRAAIIFKLIANPPRSQMTYESLHFRMSHTLGPPTHNSRRSTHGQAAIKSKTSFGDKKAARSEVVRRTKVTRSHSYAAHQYLALIGKLASAVHIMKVEPRVALESLHKLNMFLFIPQKANLELTLRKGDGHTQEGRGHCIARSPCWLKRHLRRKLSSVLVKQALLSPIEAICRVDAKSSNIFKRNQLHFGLPRRAPLQSLTQRFRSQVHQARCKQVHSQARHAIHAQNDSSYPWATQDNPRRGYGGASHSWQAPKDTRPQIA